MSAMVPGENTGIAAILFTDIEGSTVHWERDAEWMRSALAHHDMVSRDAVEACHGTVVKMLGDGMYAAFDDPLDALRAALRLQRGLADAAPWPDVALGVRCGLHLGVVERRDGDLFGTAVNRAARIMGIACGGQVLLSEPVAALVRDRLEPGASLRGLGKVRLRGVATPVQVYQLVHPSLRLEFPALRSLDQSPDNLPAQATSFVGREAEQADILRLLAKHRLVTLTGPGGVGKTRIAIRVAEELRSAFPDGVWFVDYAPLGEAGLIAETTAGALGMPLPGNAPALPALVTFLQDKKCLVILDNCEHLVAACAELTAGIVRGCPGVTLMASSRQALSVAGEHVYRIEPFPLPGGAERITAEAALRHAAVRLFADRAHAASARFAVTDENAAAVTAICRCLDGIPLAIELAAPRVKMLAPDQILHRLEDRFRILTDGARGAPPRQQTLRATIDWSYELLCASEQSLLRRLSVFAGGWTMDAAKAVGAGEAEGDGATFDALASLVDKSLVSVDFAHAEPRYRMLESTRQFASGKLDESGPSSCRRRHAEYMLRRFEKLDRDWSTTPTGIWLEAAEPELENLRTALQWGFGADGDPALAVMLFAFTGPYWIQLSLQAEFRRWLRLAVVNVADRLPPRIGGRVWLSHAQTGSPGDPVFIESALRAVALARAAEEPELLGRALAHACYLRRPSDEVAAHSHLVEAETVLRPLGRTKTLAGLLNVLGGTHQLRGDIQASRRCYAEAIDISRELDDWLGYAAPSFNLVDDDFNAGGVDAAVIEAGKLVEQCRQHRGLGLLGLMLFYLGDYLLAADRHDEARIIGVEGIRLNRSLGRSAPVNACIETVALATALQGVLERSARLAGYVAAFYHKVNFVRGPTQQRTWDRLTATLRERLPPGDVERLMAEGAGWNEESAVNEATRA